MRIAGLAAVDRLESSMLLIDAPGQFSIAAFECERFARFQNECAGGGYVPVTESRRWVYQKRIFSSDQCGNSLELSYHITIAIFAKSC